eukprot:SAG31_NODE_1159_length_9603_cov_8.927715_3_plen_104_part_00
MVTNGAATHARAGPDDARGPPRALLALGWASRAMRTAVYKTTVAPAVPRTTVCTYTTVWTSGSVGWLHSGSKAAPRPIQEPPADAPSDTGNDDGARRDSTTKL